MRAQEEGWRRSDVMKLTLDVVSDDHSCHWTVCLPTDTAKNFVVGQGLTLPEALRKLADDVERRAVIAGRTRR